jgi:hypothetical protein
MRSTYQHAKEEFNRGWNEINNMGVTGVIDGCGHEDGR